ncbi:DUF1016 family protein [bacterium]|nr:DUF1016 family protein [bacterium]
MNKDELTHYSKLLSAIKTRIRQAQVKATLSANAEMLQMYWDIGKIIDQRQQKEGWGASVIPHLSRDIRNELPDVKGFSKRNIGRMIAFYKEYRSINLFLQQPVAKIGNNQNIQPVVAQLPEKGMLPQLVAKLPWGHNILLMQKIKEIDIRIWYMQNIVEQGWSRDVLSLMIDSNAHERQGKSVTNFDKRLPTPQSDLARQALKDPYIFDFLTLDQPFREKELETGLVKHLEKFLLELGAGFAFVGRQHHIDIGEEDFYIDLLFYHLKLRCFVVIELKRGQFKPGYAGQMNFYLNVVDDKLKHETDNPTIGLILCQDKKTIVAEYALRGVNKPIGVSEYELTRALPEELKSVLPTIEEIEAELGD